MVNKINAFEAISDLGDPVVWCSIEWGGITRNSRLVRRPQLNETFYFKFAVSEKDILGNKSTLVDILTEELHTKPEVIVSVWADGHNGQIESLGTSRVPLSKLGNCKFVDRSFIDQSTRENVLYQTRVLYENARLTSAFKGNNSTVEL